MPAYAKNIKKRSTASRATGKVRTKQSATISSLLTRQRIQAKSTHLLEGDQYEKEADRIAKQLANSEGESDTKRKPSNISRLPVEQSDAKTADVTKETKQSACHNGVIRELLHVSGGKPLPEKERSHYEKSLQQDLSAVRIHNDLRADALCKRVQAQAFTYGSSIYFRSGQYKPEQRQGRLLLAHELIHVIQQGRSPTLQRKQTTGKSLTAENKGMDSLSEQINQEYTKQDKQEASNGQQDAQSEKQASQEQEKSLESLDQQVENTNLKVSENTDKEVAIELPEQAEAVPEKTAEIQSLDFKGTSDKAMLAFTEASPSTMALSQPGLARALDEKLNDESKDESESVPVLVAKASGQENLEMVSPEPVKEESGFEPKDSAGTGEEKQLTADEHHNFANAPDNTENKQLLDKQESGGFLSWFRSNFSGFLNRIKTTDNGLNTSAGERKKVTLDGDADPERANQARAESETKLVQQHKQTTQAFRDNPGQSNIKAKAVNEEKKPEVKPESNVEIIQEKDQGMADYAEMPLPEKVRKNSDELLQPSISNNLVEARKQTEDAATTKETEKKKEITQAEAKAQELNKQADKDQKNIVVENRGKVAEQQRKGIKDATDKVKEFNKNAGDKQGTLSTEVKGKVKESEASAAKELEKGEKQAEAKRQEEERKAAAKKKELEKEQENDSWWDRAVNAVKRAVKAISDAIDSIFTALREAVKFIIETAKKAAVALINKAREWVVDKLNKFRDWAKEQANTYLKDTFPGLAKAINNGIDAVVDVAIAGVNAVADTLIKGVEALTNGLAAALDKILSVFQTALKAAVQIAGAVLTGDFAGALRIAIQAACDIAGIDSKPIFDFIDRAAGAVIKILKDPVAFFMNIVKGVGGGVKNFAKNIKKHLINGLLGWLTGALSEVEITLPEKFDFKGVLSLGLQILGLTYENIKAKVIKRFPPAEKVFDLVEKGVDIVRRILIEGPIAIWEMVKESLSNLKEMVLSGIRDFVIVTVVKEAIGWLLGLLNPAGAIVKVVKLLYDFTMFLVERFQQIKDFIMSVFSTITAIASGQLGKVMSAVEDALARSLPVVLSLLASLAGLGGIGKTVQKIISKVSKPVNKVIDKIIDKIIGFVKKTLGKGKEGSKGKDKDETADEKSGSLGTVNLADLNKLPVPAQRSTQEKKVHFDRTMTLLGIISKSARTTDDIEKYFPKLKKRYRLQKIEYDQGDGGKLGINVELNPKDFFFDFNKNMLIKADDGDESVKVNQINTKDVIKYDLQVMEQNKKVKKQFSAGQEMTAEYLSFDHPAGSDSTGGKLKVAFKYLPSQTDLKGNSRYIRGHLLNANLGGKAEDENLFPITHQANTIHKNKIENEAKKLVNKEGFLVYYKVSVENFDAGIENNISFVDADFVCSLGTYHADKSKKGGIAKSNNIKNVKIRSRFTSKISEADLAEHRKKTDPEVSSDEDIDTSNAIRREDFDKNKVHWVSGLKIKYLSSMSMAEIKALPGIGEKTVAKLLNKDGEIKSITTRNQLRNLIGTRKADILEKGLNQKGHELRFRKISDIN